MSSVQEHKFVLSSDEAKRFGLFNPKGLLGTMMQETLSYSVALSRSPHVAIGRGSSGRIFIGVNVELPGLPLHQSIHAEQFLITNLILNSEPKLETLAISSDGSRYHGPCGHCCQYLQEIRNAGDIKTLITDRNGKHEVFVPLSTFLPQTYGPYNVVPENVLGLLEPRNNCISFKYTNTPLLICSNYSRCLIHTTCRAIAALNRSYAPYTNSPSGVALKHRDGRVFSGSYIESVAHSPSLGPVQAAIIDFVANGGGRDFKMINEVVLVERQMTDIPQEDLARMIIKKISHEWCRFFVLKFT